jgi:hypothetical protein
MTRRISGNASPHKTGNSKEWKVAGNTIFDGTHCLWFSNAEKHGANVSALMPTPSGGT